MLIIVPILLAVMVGLGFLQAFLSKRKGKVPGLIVPGIFFLFSFIWPLNMVSPNGDVDYLGMLFVWLLANIPTYIYLAIYFVCREKYRKMSQMDRMNIQDLD